MSKNDHNHPALLILFETCICYPKNTHCTDVGSFYLLCHHVCPGLEYDRVHELAFKVSANCCDDADTFLS